MRIELLVGQLAALAAEQRGDDLFGGAVEERVDEVAQRRLPGSPPAATTGM